MDTTTHRIMKSYISPPLWYREAYYIFNYTICIMQFFGFAINLIHISILTRPQMRSNAVYRLMIGICCCDLLTQINTFLIFSPFWIRNLSKPEDECYMTHTFFDALLYLHGTTVLDITQRGASWMALLMALFRMLSVKFPLNAKIQKISRPVFALWTILAVIIFTSLTTWMVQARRIIRDYDWDYDCDKNEIHLNQTRYGVLIPEEYIDIQARLVSIYGFIKALPSLIDPILTVFLVLELRKASRRRKNCGKSLTVDKTDNTTKLVAFVTISFFLLEVPNGFSHIVNGLFQDNVPVRTISVMIPVFAECLPIINSSSHFFVCLLMSTQYRETARTVFKCFEPRNDKVVLVEECKPTRTH